MLEQKIREIDEVVEEKKDFIRKNTSVQEKRLDFIKHIFYENYRIMADYVKREKVSIKDAFNDLTTVINSLSTPLYIEANDGKIFTLKEVNELLPVKLGYYEAINNSKLPIDKHIEQCSLELTPKGEEIYSQYRSLE